MNKEITPLDKEILDWKYDSCLDSVVPFRNGKPVGCSNKVILADKVKLAVQELKERDIQVLLWARQWAEYVDDEEVIKMWNEDKPKIYDVLPEKKVIELKEIFGELAK